MDGLEHMVYIIDDDDDVRNSLLELLESASFRALAFPSLAGYVAHRKGDVPSCLVLDVNLSDENGIEFQDSLENRSHPPIIFISGQADVRSSVRAMRAGAFNFLTKPFSDSELIVNVEAALAKDALAKAFQSELAELRSRWNILTPRERQVLPLVVSGLLDKQAAAELGISEITLQIHRGKIMRKMRAGSLADLVRMASKLGVEPSGSRRTGAQPSQAGPVGDGK